MGARAGDALPTADHAGDLLDARYRLDQIRAEHRLDRLHDVLWRAVDEPLDRHVAIRVVAGLNAQERGRLVAAATAASRLADSRFVRVLDVGDATVDDAPAVWIATEWVDAPSLAATVRGQPLPEPTAAEVVRQCAEALAGAAEHGLHHGRLHPDQVLLPTGSQPRITDLGTAAVIHRLDNVPEADDARALGGLLYAAVTARWPLGGWTGLPGLDSRTARQASPRSVRPSVDRDYDSVTHRVLTGQPAETRAVARALTRLPTRPLDSTTEPDDGRRADRWRRWAWRLIPPLLVVVIGVAGWSIGSDLGRVPTSARQTVAAVPAKKAPGSGKDRARLVWHRPPSVSGFDPEGDGVENDDQAGLAVDRDATTGWSTALYRGDSHLGGLKDGVGLLVDLGRPRSVRFVELVVTPTGADLEIRAGDQAPAQATDLTVVATVRDTGERVRRTLESPIEARYWLVWFTNLPPDNGGFRASLAEVALLG